MRYLCIHGHFYQPPRENPWLETIELQDSAYPYHDWNERITAECYAPNAAARILDPDARITRIVNNYSRISFNFGPTVLSWAKDKAPGLHQMVVDADALSRELYSGHGSAMAQCYNHMIMPLANNRDKYTQVHWGIEDFRYRFGRDPEGMWLPETAVDLQSLDIMARAGIQFTILSPYQAHLVRKIGASEWVDVTDGRIDPTRAYQLRTPSGRKIAIFFYDGPISRAVAFEGLLNNGEVFAQRLLQGYSDGRGRPELAHIATDGESYGHHHRYGEMALAYALHHIETNGLAKVTNYGEYLEKHPPAHEVEIYENTSWSCSHGVGRWTTDCGCNSGGHPGWNQCWRRPLRAALDWLRDEVAPLYERQAGKLLKDPWAARNDYIHVVLTRTEEGREQFLAKHARPTLRPKDEVTVWKLLELQRHAMLMYTSCGWFFDELSGIETVQVIQYAGRVVQLAQELFDESAREEIRYAARGAQLPPGFLEDSLESRFLEKLAHAKSNLLELRDGAHIYEKHVKPAFVDLFKVAAHYAISSVFKNYPSAARVYCYSVQRDDFRSRESGKMKLVIGRANFVSDITRESGYLTFGVLHFGDHNLHGGVREFRGDVEYEKLTQEALGAFSRADIPQVIRAFDRGFGLETYSLRSLFRDEQRNILSEILISTLDEAEAVYRQLYEHHAPLMRFLADLRTPLPKAFRTTAEYAINSHLRRAFSAPQLDIARIQHLLEEAQLGGVDLDATTLEFTLRKSIERVSERVRDDPYDLDNMRDLEQAVRLAASLPFVVTLWSVQNICHDLFHNVYSQIWEKARVGDEGASLWVDHFRNIAGSLSMRIG
jgi:alpha-amylase/alpha-mannosidase (GH57 family)